MSRKGKFSLVMSMLLVLQVFFMTMPAGFGINTAEAAIEPVASAILPDGWHAVTTYDSRNPSPVSALFADGKFSLSAEGGRVHTTGDEVLYVYTTLTDLQDKEFSLTARISDFEYAASNSWSVLMVKDGVDLTSPMYAVGFDRNGGKTRVRDYRRLSTSGGGNSTISETDDPIDPYFIRIERKADQDDGIADDLKFLYSADGVNFNSRTSYDNDNHGHYSLLNKESLNVGFAISTSSVVIDKVSFVVDGVEVFNSDHVVMDDKPPVAPTNLSTIAKDGEIELRWDFVQGAQFYTVEYGTSDGGPYSDSVNVTEPSAVINGLTNGTTYYFVVSATNINGQGERSAQVSATPISLEPPGLYEISGFALYTTGGGVLSPGDPGYRQVRNAAELADALKPGSGVKVIEIMNDLDLGWHEIPEEAKGPDSPFSSHNEPLTHPVLMQTGVSKITIIGVDGLTIFSANGSAIRHAALIFRNSNNIIIRNLEFDELWEWDEATIGDYDRNDWDYITLENTHNVWIDHTTFNKAYDGVVDAKSGSSGITISWSLFRGDDESEHSWVSQQIQEMERLSKKYPMYHYLRNTVGLSKEDIIAVSAGQKKGHLIGSAEFAADNPQLEITLHHNYYDDMMDRMPRLRAGNAHVYNVVMDSRDAYQASQKISEEQAELITAGGYKFFVISNGAISTEDGALLVENSVIRDILYPIRNNQKDPENEIYTGKIEAVNTIYSLGTEVSFHGGSEDPDSPLAPGPAPAKPFSWNRPLPYLPHDLIEPEDLETRLLAPNGAGAGKLYWEKENWLRTKDYIGDVESAPTLPTEAPAVVSGLRANASDQKVSLYWGKVNSASTYNVYRSEAPEGPFNEIASNLDVNAFIDENVTNGTSYFYKVSAVNNHGAGPQSPYVSAVPFELTPPDAPTNLNITSGSTKLILNWDAVENADYYTVKRSTVDGDEYTEIATEIFSTNYEDITAEPDILYYYVVTAINAAGESEISNQVSAELVELRDETGLKLLVHDDFNDYETGSHPSEYTVVEAGGTLKVVELPDENNKSIEFFDDRAGVVQLDKQFDSVTDLVVAQVDFMQPAKANSTKIFRLAEADGLGKTGNTVAAVAIETNGGHIAYRTQSGYEPILRNYSENTWYTIKVVADITTQKADVYINGELVKEQADFFYPISEISVFQSFTPNNNGAYYHYLDNLKVYGHEADDGGRQGPPPISWIPAVPPKAGVQVNLQLQNGVASGTINAQQLQAAFEQTEDNEQGIKRVVVEVPETAGAAAYALTLPAKAVSAAGADQELVISTSFADIVLPGHMLGNVDMAGTEAVTLYIENVDPSALSDEVAAQVGDRPVVSFRLKAGDDEVVYNNANAPVWIGIPYKPSANELSNPEHITVWYIDDAGQVTPMTSGKYNHESGMVTFRATHFSQYAVVFVEKSFSDIAHIDWAKRQIEVLASKGVIRGTSDTTFSPQSHITRADFTLLLVRTFGLTAEIGHSFDDVRPADYYYDELSIAKQLGIAQGRGDGNFYPNERVTRQDMFVIAARALKAKSMLAQTSDDLSEFKDHAEIANYAIDDLAALVQAGLVQGSNQMLRPTDLATRAEAAVFVYSIYSLLD